MNSAVDGGALAPRRTDLPCVWSHAPTAIGSDVHRADLSRRFSNADPQGGTR